MFSRKKFTGLATFFLVLGLSATIHAEELEYVEVDDAVFQGDEREQGFHGSLGVEASFNLVSNRNVVGQNDGTSILIGGGLNGRLDYLRGRHVWRNTLSYNTSWARTPTLELFVKNNDLVELESLYNYHYLDWLGPFGRFNLETSVFPTFQIAEAPRDYLITRQDGSQLRNITDELQLAESFSPLSLFQSVGVALEPVRREQITTTFRLGFGARQTFADGVLAIQDVAGTESIEVRELEDAFQAGAEAFAGIQGRLPEQRITYRLGATALIPFLNNDDTARTPLELTRLGLTGTARIALFDWMGLTYSLRILNDPQLLDEAQIQNSLLLTFNYTLIE